MVRPPQAAKARPGIGGGELGQARELAGAPVVEGWVSDMIPTPSLSHISRADYDHVYEPAEDTFILLDALEADADSLRGGRPRLCVEIGPGTGCVSAFLAQILGPSQAEYLCLDINEKAGEITVKTGKANHAPLSAVRSNLLQAIEQRAVGLIDVLLFNPPYVPTTEEEEQEAQRIDRGDESQLSAAWAGGSMGTRLLDMLIHGHGYCKQPLREMLSPGGVFYLVAIRQNQPESVVGTLKSQGLIAEITLSRRAGREHLFVIRAMRPSDT